MTNELIEKLNKAIDVLKKYEPAEGYALSFSGGRDSCVVKDILKRNSIKFKAYYAETTLEPEVFIKYLTTYHADVEWVRAEKTWHDLILEEGRIPTVRNRFCCKKGLWKRTQEINRKSKCMVTGSRYYVFERSKLRREYKLIDKRSEDNYIINPLYNWSADEVKEYVKEYAIPLMPTYEAYGSSYNCACCPRYYRETKQTLMLAHPEVYKKIKATIFKVWEQKPELHEIYPTAEDYYLFYVGNDGHEEFINTASI